MPDMTNADLLEAADLSWRFIGPGQENLTHDPDRERYAEYAELYTEDGALLLAMKRLPEWRTATGVCPAVWGPHHSEVLSARAMARAPYAETIEQLDLHLILDLETEDAREAS